MNTRNVFEVGRSVDPQTAGVWAFHRRVKLPAIHPEVSNYLNAHDPRAWTVKT